MENETKLEIHSISFIYHYSEKTRLKCEPKDKQK